MSEVADDFALNEDLDDFAGECLICPHCGWTCEIGDLLVECGKFVQFEVVGDDE